MSPLAASPGGFIKWPVILVFLYLFSIGPVMMIYDRRRTDMGEAVGTFYTPIEWLYEETFLHKPIGLYLHLWAPRLFNRSGEIDEGQL